MGINYSTRKFVCVPVLLVLLCISTMGQTPTKRNDLPWLSIIPLRATKTEVESLLGTFTKEDGRLRFYDTDLDERITIWYSGGSDDWLCSWKVPADTVIRVIVRPRKKLKAVDIAPNFAQLKKEPTETDGVWNYVDESSGVFLQIDGVDDTVIFFERAPTVKERKKCLPSR